MKIYNDVMNDIGNNIIKLILFQIQLYFLKKNSSIFVEQMSII